jgi:hypothetical protein
MTRDYEETLMLQDMHDAITECNLWDWLKTFEPKKDEGFIFTNHPNIDKISSKMKYEGHSGFSFAWCMRKMQYLAKNGCHVIITPPG